MIKTSLSAQVLFLIAMLLGQFAIIIGEDPLGILTGLITTKSFVILVDLYHAKKERIQSD